MYRVQKGCAQQSRGRFSSLPHGRKIKVDDVERMLDTIAVKPLSDRKVYFVHRADLMNVQAQNKILKTLEEPPKDVTIFLGVANEASMLSTIKSRTRNVYIDLFDEDVIYSTMLSLGLDEEMSAIAAACSEGQLGKAKKIATSPKYAELYKLALYVLDNLNRSSDVAKVDGLMIAEQDLGGLLDVMSIILRDMLVAKATKTLCCQSMSPQALPDSAKNTPLAHLQTSFSESTPSVKTISQRQRRRNRGRLAVFYFGG